MRFFLLNKALEEKDIAPCYFLYGEETFLAQEFLGQLATLLVPADGQEFNLERFHFEDTSWPEVIDMARTAPFLFSTWRVISLELPASDRRDGEEGARKGRDVFPEKDENLVRDYLNSPAGRTVLTVVLPGRASASRRIVKFFTSFPEEIVVARELKPLKGAGLSSWIDRKLGVLGKVMTAEGKSRLADLIGNDLQRLDKELDKLATYIGDKKSIEEEDVDAAAGWTKEMEGWELERALKSRDLRRALAVLANFFSEGKAPELILGMLSNLFRDMLSVQESLREGRDRRAVFLERRPQMRAYGGSWLQERMREFYEGLEGLSLKDLDGFLQALGRIDYRLKTSDVSARTEIEAFVVEFCRRLSPGGVTSRAGRR